MYTRLYIYIYKREENFGNCWQKLLNYIQGDEEVTKCVPILGSNSV